MPPDSAHREHTRHDPALDGIRGLAILLVLAHHLFFIGDTLHNPALEIIHRAQLSAWLGVDLFFALSGYLITGILWNSLGGPGYFRSFYARRSLRIWPLYYGVLLVLGALTLPLHLDWHGHYLAFILYAQNLGFVRTPEAYSLSPDLRLVHFWSLAIEEQFYLVWPLALLLLRRRQRVIVVALSGAVLSLVCRIVFLHAGATPWTVFTCTPCRLDGILLGSALAVALCGPARDRILRIAPAVALICFALLLLFAYPNGLDWRISRSLLTFGISVIALGSAALIAWAVTPGSLLRQPLSSRLFRFFGRYSYGIYVFHYIESGRLETTLRKALIPVLHSRVLAGFVASSLYFALSIGLALLSFHLFESRFLRLKRYFQEPHRAASSAVHDTVPEVDAQRTR